ncbi:uncharacterized protein TNCV_1665201 [Trichonephila clavipes]|nr:uncharacterized protein TNCV_1665201 [Trichonephila clavipes]
MLTPPLVSYHAPQGALQFEKRCCKAKTGLSRSSRGSPHTNTIVITTEIRSGFIAKDVLVSFHRSPLSSCAAPLQTEASMGRRHGQARNGRCDPKCPSARRLRMVREDTGAPNEGATCTWMAADKGVGCMRAFRTMWRSTRRLVIRGRPRLAFV